MEKFDMRGFKGFNDSAIKIRDDLFEIVEACSG